MKNYFINDNNCKLFGVRSSIANAAKRGEAYKNKQAQANQPSVKYDEGYFFKN